MAFQKQKRELISNLPYDSNADWENSGIWTRDLKICDGYPAKTQTLTHQHVIPMSN